MFNKRTRIKDLLADEATGKQAVVMGWVRTFRNNQFIALNDGSTNNNLQVVASLGEFPEDVLKRITTGASLRVEGDKTVRLILPTFSGYPNDYLWRKGWTVSYYFKIFGVIFLRYER